MRGALQKRLHDCRPRQSVGAAGVHKVTRRANHVVVRLKPSMTLERWIAVMGQNCGQCQRGATLIDSEDSVPHNTHVDRYAPPPRSSCSLHNLLPS